MNDVFVAYAEADQAKAGILITRLEDAGFSVWSHADLPSGENWHANIESALEAAKCVVVLWSRTSTGEAGDFVRDQARRAKERGVLVPALIQKVDPPLGFREFHAIDLSRWRSSARNAHFRDLCAAVQARIDGRSIPAPVASKVGFRRRITYGAAIAAFSAFFALSFNFFAAQGPACSIPFLQPAVSDICGALGFGGRPSKAERLAWGSREIGSCQALRDHVDAYPEGAYRQVAADLIAARTVTEREEWTPSERRLALFIGQGEAHGTETEAQRDALERAGPRVERLCKGFVATTLSRVESSRSSTAEAQIWECSATEGGQACGFDGEAVCQVEERRVVEIEACRMAEGDPLR